jgi:hypothetical protein
MQISVTPQGDTVFIDNDDFDASFLGCTSIARASHVEPCEGGWFADMSPVGGPVLTGFTMPLIHGFPAGAFAERLAEPALAAPMALFISASQPP